MKIKHGMNIAFIGNTLLDRSQDFGYLEALLHQAHPNHDLTVRNLAWPADALGLQPRPANFADTDQHSPTYPPFVHQHLTPHKYVR